MKRHGLAATAVLCCALTLSGCGIIRTANAIGSIFGGRKKVKTIKKIVKIIGSVLGQFYDTTTKKSLVGDWTYAEPAIQFETQSFLDKAGGVVASQTVADNIAPYFNILGFKQGNLSISLREDNTCTYTLGGKTYQGTYDYDDENKKITLKTPLFPLPAAYISVAEDQMALTFDSSKILTLIQALGMVSKDQTPVSAVSTLASSYDGMKTGFTFVKVK
ncbi:MAG: DUF4923 family protein [Candidatus Cryptobacteroides sp.]|jgi:hypothetical protein|nr:DUF4923 family protein [Candidatus Cryptobacteroides sp.]